MGSRLQNFNLWPKHPNRLEPGKRPRITLTPTIVLDEQRRPVVAVSIAGGDNQDQLAVQLLVDLLDRGVDPATAVRSPRFLSDHLIGSFRQTEPALGKLRIDPGFGEETLATLKARGHVLEVKAGPLASAPVVLKIIPGEEGPPQFQVAGDPATGRHVDAR
jgi:gamma-glutamyltranspeptidase/glutathione hydrolase